MAPERVRNMSDTQDEKGSNVQDLAKAMLDAQLGAIRRTALTQAETFGNLLNSLGALTQFGAVFKTTVQKAGRISIPEAERKALGIKEGDLVQVVLVPLKRG